MSQKAYKKIEEVFNVAKRHLAPHEFNYVSIPKDGVTTGGREYVGYSESTLGRRLREMVTLGLATSRTREGKNFKEFALAVKAAPTLLLLAMFVGCAAAPVKPAAPAPVVWGPKIDTLQAPNGCADVFLGYEDGGALRWSAKTAACPKPPEAVKKAVKAKR